MFGIIMAPAPRPRRWWQRKPRPTLREIGVAVSQLQRAEGRAIHGQRDGCLGHMVEAQMTRGMFARVVPRHLLADPQWRHEHIEAPGVRIQARVEEFWARREGDES